MDKNVNERFLNFLNNNETGLYKKTLRSSNGYRIIAYVHIDFSDLSDFVEIVGDDWFNEGGIEVQMFSDSVCIELNDIMETFDQSLINYRNCFNKDDWNELEEYIMKDWEE